MNIRTELAIYVLVGTYGQKHGFEQRSFRPSFNKSNYLTTLNQRRFCLTVAGISGWSPRLIDTVYAGCLLVFIMSSTHFPFEDILDCEKFSIHIPEDQLYMIKDSLLRYGDSELLSKQKYLVLGEKCICIHK